MNETSPIPGTKAAQTEEWLLSPITTGNYKSRLGR